MYMKENKDTKSSIIWTQFSNCSMAPQESIPWPPWEPYGPQVGNHWYKGFWPSSPQSCTPKPNRCPFFLSPFLLSSLPNLQGGPRYWLVTSVCVLSFDSLPGKPTHLHAYRSGTTRLLVLFYLFLPFLHSPPSSFPAFPFFIFLFILPTLSSSHPPPLLPSSLFASPFSLSTSPLTSIP